MGVFLLPQTPELDRPVVNKAVVDFNTPHLNKVKFHRV